MVGIAPPSMSKAISVLEDELGCKLIHPEGRGIGITPKGLEVYRLSCSLLEEYKKFHHLLSAKHEDPTQWRIATFEIFSSYFLSSFLYGEPGADVLLLEMTPGKIEAAILSGQVHLGLTNLPAPDPLLEYREIGRFEMGIFGHKKWESIPFSDWPFAVPVTELRIHSSDVEALDMWPRFAPKRKIKYRFELLETALQTSRLGLSVLHCPDFIVRLHNQHSKPNFHLNTLAYPAGYKRLKSTRVYLVARKGAVPIALERKLAKFMRSLS